MMLAIVVPVLTGHKQDLLFAHKLVWMICYYRFHPLLKWAVHFHLFLWGHGSHNFFMKYQWSQHFADKRLCDSDTWFYFCVGWMFLWQTLFLMDGLSSFAPNWILFRYAIATQNEYILMESIFEVHAYFGYTFHEQFSRTMVRSI